MALVNLTSGSVFPLHDDIINKMPVLGAWMHPGRLFASVLAEDDISDNQIMSRTLGLLIYQPIEVLISVLYHFYTHCKLLWIKASAK